MQAPPGRYKIIERGRRLVTVDTTTGLEIDLLPASSSRDLTGATKQLATVAPTVVVNEPARPSALNPGGSSSIGPDSDNSARVAILLVGGLVLVVFLIASGAWIPVTIALLIPPVRALVFAAAKTAITRFLNGGGPA